MRYSAEHKARVRKTIVKGACRCFKEAGIEGVSIADLMEAVGLTHGGFYSHFVSKDALAADAISEGLEQSREYLLDWGGKASASRKPIEIIINNYLSTAHRDHIPSACPLPLLTADIARGKPKAKAAFAVKVKEIMAVLNAFAASSGTRDRDVVAIGVLSGMVGAMLLARAIDDPQYSDQILKASREFLKQALASPSGGKEDTQAS